MTYDVKQATGQLVNWQCIGSYIWFLYRVSARSKASWCTCMDIVCWNLTLGHYCAFSYLVCSSVFVTLVVLSASMRHPGSYSRRQYSTCRDGPDLQAESKPLFIVTMTEHKLSMSGKTIPVFMSTSYQGSVDYYWLWPVVKIRMLKPFSYLKLLSFCHSLIIKMNCEKLSSRNK